MSIKNRQFYTCWLAIALMLRGCICPGQWGKLWQASGGSSAHSSEGLPTEPCHEVGFGRLLLEKGALASIQLRFVVLQDYTTAMGNTWSEVPK